MVKKVSSGTRLPSSNPGCSPNGYEILDESLNPPSFRFPSIKRDWWRQQGQGLLCLLWMSSGLRTGRALPATFLTLIISRSYWLQAQLRPSQHPRLASQSPSLWGSICTPLLCLPSPAPLPQP